MFVPGKPFQRSLMFAGKAGAYPSEAHFRCSAHAYFENPQIKSFTIRIVGKVFNSRSGCMCAMLLCSYEAKRGNIKLKIGPKYFFKSSPVSFCAHRSILLRPFVRNEENEVL
jgi:hypothetical protein